MLRRTHTVPGLENEIGKEKDVKDDDEVDEEEED